MQRLPLPRPHLGPWPATQACALTRNEPATFLVPHQAWVFTFSWAAFVAWRRLGQVCLTSRFL